MKGIIPGLVALLVFGTGLIAATFFFPQMAQILAGAVALLIAVYAWSVHRSFCRNTEDLLSRLRVETKEPSKLAGEIGPAPLGAAYRAFMAQLVDLPGSRKRQSRSPAEDFFNRHSLLEQTVNLPAYEVLPNLLIGVGILFTFVGIVVVLVSAGADVGSLASTEAQDAQRSLGNLFQTLSVKFITSISGIACSSLLTLAIKGRINEFSSACHRLVSRLDREFPPLSYENEMLSLLRSLGGADAAQAMQQAADALHGSAGQLGAQMQSLVAAQERLTPEAIGGQVGHVIEQQFAPVFREIRDSLGVLQTIKADQGQEIVENLMRELRSEVIEPVLGQMSENSMRTAEVATLIGSLQNTLEGSLVETVKKLEESSGVIQKFQSETLRKLGEFAERLSGILQQFQDETSGVLDTVAHELKGAIAESIAGLASQRTSFEESATTIQGAFRDVGNEIERSLKQQVHDQKEMLGEVHRELASMVEGANRMVAETARGVQEATQEGIRGLEHQRSAFQESANQAAESFRGIRQDLVQALDHQAELEEKRLSAMANRVQGLLDGVESSFKVQMETLEGVGREASQTMQAARSELLIGMAEIHDTLRNTSGVVREELHNFRVAYQEALVAFFNEQNHLLDETMRAHRDGLSSVVRDLESAFENETRQLSEAQHHFGASIDHLLEVQQELQRYAVAVGLDSGARVIELGELATRMSLEAANVSKQYENLVMALDGTMRGFASNVNDLLHTLGEGQMEYYGKHDTAMTSVLDRLLDATEALAEVKDLVKKA